MAKSKYSDQLRKIADFCKTFSKVGQYKRGRKIPLFFYAFRMSPRWILQTSTKYLSQNFEAYFKHTQ